MIIYLYFTAFIKFTAKTHSLSQYVRPVFDCIFPVKQLLPND